MERREKGTYVKEKKSMSLVKMVRPTFIQGHVIEIGTGEKEFYSGGGDWFNSKYSMRSGNSWPRNKVGVSGWKIIKRKHSCWGDSM